MSEECTLYTFRGRNEANNEADASGPLYLHGPLWCCRLSNVLEVEATFQPGSIL